MLNVQEKIDRQEIKKILLILFILIWMTVRQG